jgi:hypothetical protein
VRVRMVVDKPEPVLNLLEGTISWRSAPSGGVGCFLFRVLCISKLF